MTQLVLNSYLNTLVYAVRTDLLKFPFFIKHTLHMLNIVYNNRYIGIEKAIIALTHQSMFCGNSECSARMDLHRFRLLVL